MTNAVSTGWLSEIVAALFILLFVYTGISKLAEQNSFHAALAKAPLIGSKANFISWCLPTTELIIALLLFLPFMRKWGLMIGLAFMCLFTGHIFYMIVFTPYLPCSCGGVLKQMTWTRHLEFNMLLTALAAFGIWVYQKYNRFIAINPGSAEASRGRQDKPNTCIR